MRMKLLGMMMAAKRKASGKTFSEDDIARLKAKAQTDAGACELMEDAAKQLTALTDLITDRDRRAVIEIYYAALRHVIQRVREGKPGLFTEKENRPDADGAKERAYCVLESAMIRLHVGLPLHFPFEEMSEYNATMRRELIMALLLALDLLRQNGVSVEQTAQAEMIRREYTSG